MSTRNKAGYNMCSVQDDAGKTHHIYVGRALASSREPPPTPKHTADHIDRDKNNDILENIRWATKHEQRDNRTMPETLKSAFIIVKDCMEKTAKEWEDHLKNEKNPFGREYTKNIIKHYAKQKQFGFSYKEYPELPGEVWKNIICSENSQGRWEISNDNRVKYITTYAENVLSGDRLGLKGGYPIIRFNGKQMYCHILSFMTFFPDEWVNKKSGELVLHEDDDRNDFRPHKLRLGTRSKNGIDAHNNGKYGDKQTKRMRCTSYIKGVFEKEHDSQHYAIKYLRSNGFYNAKQGNISMALSGDRKTAYGRTWKRT